MERFEDYLLKHRVLNEDVDEEKDMSKLSSIVKMAWSKGHKNSVIEFLKNLGDRDIENAVVELESGMDKGHDSPEDNEGDDYKDDVVTSSISKLEREFFEILEEHGINLED